MDAETVKRGEGAEPSPDLEKAEMGDLERELHGLLRSKAWAAWTMEPWWL